MNVSIEFAEFKCMRYSFLAFSLAGPAPVAWLLAYSS